MKDLEKLWVGIVEDNKDPRKLGRIRVRVQGLFDSIATEEIPWVLPMKSLSARSFEVPAIGKIVSVLYPNKHLHEGYYMLSDNYNVNLKKKLNDLDPEEYVDFVAVVFDHRTKIYSDDTELTTDYKYNKMTISNDNINMELKDNSRKLNLGSKSADQQAVLGNHWFDWMDKFVEAMLQPMNMMGNYGTPILKPNIDKLLLEYQALRQTFVSKNVYVVDNQKVDKLEMNYNSPIMDDGAKINNKSVAKNSDDLALKIQQQKNKALDELKGVAPSNVSIIGETIDDPEGDAEDVDIMVETKDGVTKEITKERFDAVKKEESTSTNLEAYDIVDEQSDADDIAYQFKIDQIEEYESSDPDDIAYDYDPNRQFVYNAPDRTKYVDEVEVRNMGASSYTGPTTKVSCSQINSSNFSYDLKISEHFKLGDLSKNTSFPWSIPESKTLNGITYTKYDIACNLMALSVNVLDKIYSKYPDVKINSGFRDKRNKFSQHEIGQAADLRFTGHRKSEYLTIAQWIHNNVPYDQLLFEFRESSSVWIHVSFNPKGNRGIDSPYPKYATFLNDKTYKRLQLVNVAGWNFA